MKSIRIDGTDIYYAEANAEAAETIFFLHGNSSSHHTWDEQLTSQRLQRYRMIAFDLPAHGVSGTMPDYSLPALGEIMSAVVEQLGNGKPYLLAGVSLGTNIIAEMLAHSVQPVALVLAGPCIMGNQCPFDKIAIPDTPIGLTFTDDPSAAEIKTLISIINFNQFPPLKEQLAREYQSVKDNFRSKLGKSVADRNYSDELALLEKRKIPVLVIFGAADAAIYPDYLDGVVSSLHLWNEEIIKLADAGHWVHLDKPKAFNELLGKIAKDVFK